MSFQKDRRLSVSTKVPKNFARTPPPAFLFPDQRFQRPHRKIRLNRLTPVRGGGRCLAPLIFRVNQFFLKNFLNTPETRRPRRRRPSKESLTPSQQGFSAFSQNRKTKAFPSRPAKSVSEPCDPPVSERAADIRTQPRLHKPRMTVQRTISTNASPATGPSTQDGRTHALTKRRPRSPHRIAA